MKKFLLLFLFFSFSFFLGAQEITTINILNSHKTEYKKNPDTGNETIILDGNVELSVLKGNVNTKITADSVSYDRETKILFADGNIHLISTGSNAGDEDITANSLILNTSTLEGVFDGGRVVQKQSDAINLPSGSTLVVFSDMFGKSESNVLSFKNASLTFCDDEDPHWKINASRIWLLSGGEFAFLNALLYVGKVPVLYLPAFYYPKDELIFNPVFGFKPREGYYIQTTTYLYGRKPLNSSKLLDTSSEDKGDEALESLYSFMKPSSLKEQVREGIVLHNLDSDYTGNTSDYVKLMADWYSNLGYIVGIEGNLLPKKSVFTKLQFGLDFGFTNTVFQSNGLYSNISPTGIKYWESSNFLSVKLPFRYKMDLQMSINKPFNLSLSMPVYSDPNFGYEIQNRSENFNWISSIKELLDSQQVKFSDSSSVSSFSWVLNASWSPSLPAFLRPYISSFSLSASSKVNISSKETSSSVLLSMGEYEWTRNTSQGYFYYPSQVTPFTARVSVSGTLFQYPLPEKKSVTSQGSNSQSLDLNEPEETGLENENSLELQNNEPETEEDFLLKNFTVPEIAVTIPTVSETTGFRYSLNYSLSSDYNSQLAYAAEKLKSPDDFRWENYKSFMYTLNMPIRLSSSMSYGGSLFSMSNNLSYQPLWQSHPFISMDSASGGYSASQAKSLRETDYKAERQDIINSNSVTFRPFHMIPVISNSSITWNTNFKLYQRNFIGTEEDPLWKDTILDWTKDTVTANSLTFNMAANELNNLFTQSFSFTATLPPLEDRYSMSLSLGFPYVKLSFGTGFYKTVSGSVEDWKWTPLTENLSFSWKLLQNNLTFTQGFTFNLQEGQADSLKFSLGWAGLSVSYVMSNTVTYDFDTDTVDSDGTVHWGQGWVAKPGKEFVPYSLSASYSLPSKTFYTWKNRVKIAPTLSTSLVADLVRPTNSYFTFSPGITFKLNNFLDLTFSTTSRNSVIYRYFQAAAGYPGRIPGETNMFVDLFNSFRFDNEEIRKSSGFKLKSLNLSLNHELHDWKFQMSLKVEPRQVTGSNGKKYYDFNPYFSIGVIWSPMEALKTTIIDEYGEWKLD